MNVTIDITDYLSQEEIIEECKYAIRSSVQEMFCRNENDIDRLINNLGYEFIFGAVSKAIGKDAAKVIAEKVEELIKDDSSIKYEMWRKKDTWGRDESPAIKMLYEAIENNKPLMEQRVREEIMKHELYEMQDIMYNIACDVLYNRIFAKE